MKKYPADRFDIESLIYPRKLADVTKDEPEILSETKTTVGIYRTLTFSDGIQFPFHETARLGKPRKDGSRLVGKSLYFEV